ncbi:MAG: PSD1 domain-containing protein, partial [Planctomycetales bacterium]|nr:PSD1 domain-containing protein [Planctomycetales bacterium]
MPSYSYFHVNRVPVLLRFVVSGWIVAMGLLVGSLTLAAEQAEIDFFESKIRPVLVRHCYECHSAEGGEVKGGLRLDTRDAIRRGGDSGPAVVPGDVDGSLLIDAVRYESFEMPPTGRLPDHVVADLTKWIEAGAADPREETSPTTNVAESSKPKIDFAEARQFWSFQRPSRHEPPHVEQTDWIRRPIDAFVLARMETASLSPNAQADRRTLVRRLSFDLLGLPPTPEEVAAFEADDSPRAYERLVERLLASPRFGERWARLWLDVARYAEDQAHIVGNNKELFYPNAYKYRDWVIQAFNQDLPYDQFVRLQLAADLIDDDPANDVALGFIGLGPKYYRRNAPEVMADEWEDRVDTVGRGLLGLTVACARCHDHKYDPIPTEDYYALAGVFAGTQMFNRPMDAERETKNGGEAKNPDESFHVVRDDKPTDLAVMIRGDVNNRGPVVPRRFLQVLCDGEPTPFQDGSGRRELAESIASTDNPLTARVIVNRIWGQYFGSPLVSTASNFGALGQRPTHPELLDDLAARFMENGWSLKWLHREIVMSATYQQSSQAEAAKVAADPANQWLARMPRRRLSVESWRDAVLSAGGSLSDVIGGQSVDPTAIDAKSDAGQRRTVYSEVSRFQLHPLLAMFDFPDPNAHSGGRVETTTPLQKLFVLNSPWMVEQARRLAERTAT